MRSYGVPPFTMPWPPRVADLHRGLSARGLKTIRKQFENYLKTNENNLTAYRNPNRSPNSVTNFRTKDYTLKTEAADAPYHHNIVSGRKQLHENLLLCPPEVVDMVG